MSPSSHCPVSHFSQPRVAFSASLHSIHSPAPYNLPFTLTMRWNCFHVFFFPFAAFDIVVLFHFLSVYFVCFFPLATPLKTVCRHPSCAHLLKVLVPQSSIFDSLLSLPTWIFFSMSRASVTVRKLTTTKFISLVHISVLRVRSSWGASQ